MKLYGFKDSISCGLHLHNPEISDSENQFLYGQDWSPKGSGCNYEIELAWQSEYENKSIESCIRNELKYFDHCVLEERLTDSKLPTLENIAQDIWKHLNRFHKLHLLRITQYNGDYLQIQKGKEDQPLLGRLVNASSLHRHHNNQLSAEENKSLYGKCSEIHGHEYKVAMEISGEVDCNTGLVFNRTELEELGQKFVYHNFHGKLVNDSIGNVSGELFLLHLQDLLQGSLPSHLQLSIHLQETQKNCFFSVS